MQKVISKVNERESVSYILKTVTYAENKIKWFTPFEPN